MVTYPLTATPPTTQPPTTQPPTTQPPTTQPPTTQPPTTQPPTPVVPGLSTGQLAGIILGAAAAALCLLASVIALCWYCERRRRTGAHEFKVGLHSTTHIPTLRLTFVILFLSTTHRRLLIRANWNCKYFSVLKKKLLSDFTWFGFFVHL